MTERRSPALLGFVIRGSVCIQKPAGTVFLLRLVVTIIMNKEIDSPTPSSGDMRNVGAIPADGAMATSARPCIYEPLRVVRGRLPNRRQGSRSFRRFASHERYT